MTGADFLRQARLTLSLARLELDSQRKDTFLGLAWFVLWPAAQAGGFLLVFHLIRGGNAYTDSAAIAAAYLGVLIWSTAVSVLMSNLGILKHNREMITHIRFPFAILPVVDVTVKYLVFLVQLLIAVLLWLVLVPNDHWPWVLAYLPLYLVAFYCVLVGMAWLASLIGVAAPDCTFVIPPVSVLLLALSPVFQPDAGALPWLVQRINDLNPLSAWVSAFYATVGIPNARPAAPVFFLCGAVAALVLVRAVVGVFYRNVAKVI
jgi:lipopolysaccharide transport system permease protein